MIFSRQVRGAGDDETSVRKPADEKVSVVQVETPEIDNTAVAEPEMPYASDEPVNEKMPAEPEEALSEDTFDDGEIIESVDAAASAPAAFASADISSAWAKTLEKIDAPLASKISQATIELKENELLLILNGGQAVFEDAIKKNLKSLESIIR
jgi:cell pole-organizing protein PopZ